jgi:hypothetical protein
MNVQFDYHLMPMLMNFGRNRFAVTKPIIGNPLGAAEQILSNQTSLEQNQLYQ